MVNYAGQGEAGKEYTGKCVQQKWENNEIAFAYEMQMRMQL